MRISRLLMHKLTNQIKQKQRVVFTPEVWCSTRCTATSWRWTPTETSWCASMALISCAGKTVYLFIQILFLVHHKPRVSINYKNVVGVGKKKRSGNTVR